MMIATSVVRGTAAGNAVAATIEAGVTIVNPGSDGVGPAPAMGDVTTGMYRRAVAQVGSTVAVTTSAAAMATAAATTGTRGNAGIVTSTGTSAAMTARGVSAVPGGTARNIHTLAATMSVAAVMIADPEKHAAISANRVTSIPSNRIK